MFIPVKGVDTTFIFFFAFLFPPATKTIMIRNRLAVLLLNNIGRICIQIVGNVSLRHQGVCSDISMNHNQKWVILYIPRAS